jgi:hypothetical protein
VSLPSFIASYTKDGIAKNPHLISQTASILCRNKFFVRKEWIVTAAILTTAIALGIRQSQRDPSPHLAGSLRVLAGVVIAAVLLCDACLKIFGHGFQEFSPGLRSAAALAKILELSALLFLTLRTKPGGKAIA